MNELQIFNNDEFGSVRTVEINGEPWFIAADVCRSLELSNPTASMERLDEDEKAKFNLGLPGGDTNCVNEYGLYSLVLGSRKPDAKKFKRWITHEVIPEIRRTGGYQLPQTYSEALRALADKADEADRLAIENNRMKPKADFYDAVASSKDVIDIGDAAKVLAVPGVGRNKLFSILRDRRILMSNNIPYQKYIDRGYFKLIEQSFTTPDGETRVSVKTVVYQKGVDAIRKLLESLESGVSA